MSSNVRCQTSFTNERTRVQRSNVTYMYTCTCGYRAGKVDRRRISCYIIADSITNSFFECGTVALELVGFVSEAGSRARATRESEQDKKHARAHTRVHTRGAVCERGGCEGGEGFRSPRTSVYKGRETRPLLEYGGRCKNKSFLFKPSAELNISDARCHPSRINLPPVKR